MSFFFRYSVGVMPSTFRKVVNTGIKSADIVAAIEIRDAGQGMGVAELGRGIMAYEQAALVDEPQVVVDTYHL